MIILVVLLSACAKHLTKNEVESIQRVGITNHFPEYFTRMTADIALPEARGLRQIHDVELKKFVGADGRAFNSNTIKQFAYKLSAGTLISLTEQLSLDVNYQYVNLGAFKGSTEYCINGDCDPDIAYQKGINGGEIKSQELMVGLQYKFN